jgi:hypothetical protein
VALVREQTIPTEQLPLADEVSDNFADIGCRVVSAADPYGRHLHFSGPVIYLYDFFL